MKFMTSGVILSLLILSVSLFGVLGYEKPIFIKTITVIEEYPLLVQNDISYCWNKGYFLFDIKDWPYPPGNVLAREGNITLLEVPQMVPVSDQPSSFNISMYDNQGEEYHFYNVATSYCKDPPNPLDNKLKYIPETYFDTNYYYKPTNTDPQKGIPGGSTSVLNSPFSVEYNDGSRGYYVYSFKYNVENKPNSTNVYFSLKTATGATTNYTIPTFLDQYYPPGNVVDVRFYPTNGVNQNIKNPIVIELEATGNPVFGAAQFHIPYFTKQFYPVSKSADGKTKYLSAYRMESTGLTDIAVKASVFNKETPVFYETTWTASPSSAVSSTSTNSSFFVVDSVKELSLVNVEINGLVNLPSTDILLWRNVSYTNNYFIGSGTEKNNTYSQSFLSHFKGNIAGIRTLSGITFPDIPLPFTQTDFEAPKVTNIEFEYLSSGYCLIRVHITDNQSGFSRLFFSVPASVITPQNLVSGNLLDGVYELRTQTFLLPSVIRYGYTINDKAGNEKVVSTTNSFRPYYLIDAQIPELPSPTFDYEDITTFKFEPNNINVTTFGSLCTLYFGYKGMTSDNMPPVFIRLTKSTDYLLETTSFADIPLMQWDTSLNLYKYQFFIPPRLFSGNIDYQVYAGSLNINPTIMYQFFGEKALLKVYSDISDEMPPIVTKYSFSPSSVTINQGQSVQVTLTVDIEDPINGLDYGSIKIGSDYDSKVGYSFTFTPVDAINKNPYYGTYQFKFTVNGNCRSQSFKIVDISLTDTSGHKSSVNSNTPQRINPLYKLYDTPVTMPLTCTATVDTTPPTIKSLTFSRTSFASSNSLDREITVTMTAEDLNGISLRHTPYLYMVDDVLAENKVPFSIVSSDSTKVNYKLTTRIPFNYGTDVGFIVGIYGLYDNHLNTNGYSSEDLRKAGFTYFIKTQITTTPVLESYLPILSTGGDLHVYGQRFNGNNVVISIDYRDGNGYQPVSTIKKTATSFTIGNVLPKKTSLFVKITVDGFDSNEMLVIPTPVKSTESFCKGDPICGGPNRGYCPNEQTGCICYPPYFGIDCSNTDALGGSNPNIDPTTPNTGNNVTTDEISFGYYISITELKELDLNGGTVQHYYLKDWTFTNVSTTVRKEYQYSTNITNNQVLTHVSVNLRFYDKQEQVIFANNEYYMSPNSVKYIVTMTPYGFSSRLNYLELVMASNFTLNSNDGCSSISKGNSSINAEYIQLKVNDHYLYSRFIKLGEIDSKPQEIVNKFIENKEEQTKASAVSYVGVQIPFYTKSVLLDPDFSVLINTDKPASTDENAVCGDKEEAQSSKDGLTKVQIAGIVIGTVGFAAVVAVGISYSVYKNKKSANARKNMQTKLDTFNSPK